MKNKYVTFGEIMLRLKSPPGHERFFQSPALEATFGGGEANVAVSLSLLGKDSRFVTALPSNAIGGEAAAREVRKYGVDTSAIKMTKVGRVGIYFWKLEQTRGPVVLYMIAQRARLLSVNLQISISNQFLLMQNGSI